MMRFDILAAIRGRHPSAGRSLRVIPGHSGPHRQWQNKPRGEALEIVAAGGELSARALCFERLGEQGSMMALGIRV